MNSKNVIARVSAMSMSVLIALSCMAGCESKDETSSSAKKEETSSSVAASEQTDEKTEDGSASDESAAEDTSEEITAADKLKEQFQLLSDMQEDSNVSGTLRLTYDDPAADKTATFADFISLSESSELTDAEDTAFDIDMSIQFGKQDENYLFNISMGESPVFELLYVDGECYLDLTQISAAIPDSELPERIKLTSEDLTYISETINDEASFTLQDEELSEDSDIAQLLNLDEFKTMLQEWSANAKFTDDTQTAIELEITEDMVTELSDFIVSLSDTLNSELGESVSGFTVDDDASSLQSNSFDTDVELPIETEGEVIEGSDEESAAETDSPEADVSIKYTLKFDNDKLAQTHSLSAVSDEMSLQLDLDISDAAPEFNISAYSEALSFEDAFGMSVEEFVNALSEDSALTESATSSNADSEAAAESEAVTND